MKKCILFTLLCALALPLFAACGDPAGSESAASSSAPSASSGDESEPFVENERIAQINRCLSEEVDRTLPCTNILKGLSYTASKEPNADYADNTSAPKLTDGVTTDLFDKYNWLGFSGTAAFTIDFDLGEGHDQAIADISVGCLRQLDYGIGLPASVSVLVSEDGEQYTEIGKLYTPTGLDSSDKHVYNFCFPKATTARYIRISFANSEKFFHFIDEISAYVYSEDGEGPKEDPSAVSPGADIYDYALDLSPAEPYPGKDDADYTARQNLARLEGVDVQIQQFGEIIESALEANSPAEDKFMLIDGQKMTTNAFSDPALYHFVRGDGRNVVIDLNYLMGVSGWSLELSANAGAGLGCPMNLVVSLSEDGESWTTVDAVHSETRGKNGNETVTLGGELDDAYKARYVRFSFVVDNGQWNVTDHYVSVYMSEIEVFGTKSAESAKPAEDCGSVYGRFASPDRLDGVRNLLFAGVGSLSTDAFTYDNAMDIFAVRDESGKVTGLLMDAVCMAKANTLGFTPQSIESYEQYFEIIFDEEKNLGAIEKARGEINEALGITDKLPVYLSVFTMHISDNVFGEIDGETVDYSDNENRSRAVRYIIDRYIEAFNAQGYENLYLAGFYWENEAISVDTPAEDIELVKQFNAYAHEKGFKTFWVPYFDANYYYYWDQLGFDLACMQSNYSFTVIDEQRLYANAWLCWVNGLSAELEIEDYKSKAGTDKYKAYLECGVKTGYADSVNVYYQGGIPGAIFSSKDYNDDEFGVYRDTCLYASGEMPADYYEPSGAGLEGLPAELTLETTDGKAVEFTLEGIDGLESEITLLPFYGALRLNADGTGRYEPISRFVGEDSFAVTVTDGAGQSKTISVTITITH